MGFTCTSYAHSAIEQRDNTIVVLEEQGSHRIEIWPALGFNCFSWKANVESDPLDILYLDPDTFFTGERATRTGIPILFPFPNRIRDGRFTWEGQTYQLPLNDPALANAIHGFTTNRPWRVLDQGADEESAWVRAEFRGSVDAPDCRAYWPSDYWMKLTYRLKSNALRLEAEVVNPDIVPLPFGLGYHPYFHMPFGRQHRQEDCRITVPAEKYWKLEDTLPTGDVRPVVGRLDLRQPRPFPTLVVDDVLTALPNVEPTEEGLVHRATVRGAPQSSIEMFCSPSFRELVAFVPPHREAFSVEPYTCVTDAVNLQAKDIDAGWQVLPPGGHWSSVVEFRLATS